MTSKKELMERIIKLEKFDDGLVPRLNNGAAALADLVNDIYTLKQGTKIQTVNNFAPEAKELSKQVSTHINDHRVYSERIEKRFAELVHNDAEQSIWSKSHEKWIRAHEDLLKVHVQKIGDLGRYFTVFSDRVESLETTRNFLNKEQGEMRERISKLEKANEDALKAHGTRGLRIAVLEKEIKDQREDYHAHIRQLVEENEAVHNRHKEIIDHLLESVARHAIVIENLENRLDGLTVWGYTDAVMERKKPGRPKKAHK